MASPYLPLFLLLSLLLVVNSKPVNPLHSKEQRYAAEADFLNGVNFGGWLVTEPSWMYDQFNAPAENDLIRHWRNQGGDDYAVQAIRNHWGGYITDDNLDTIQEFGVTHVRIPVGYWIVDIPVTPPGPHQHDVGGSMYDYGFNCEGFVTGGMNYLEDMLKKLKNRGIEVIIDLHAPPGGGSSCSSYSGVIESDENKGFWRGSPYHGLHTPTGCTGGPYSTSRSPKETWLKVGEEFVNGLADWIVGLQSNGNLSDTVIGLELVNEPGLGWGGLQGDIEGYISTMVPSVQNKFNKAGLTSMQINTNWIGPNDYGAGDWLAQQQTKYWDATPPTVVDVHNYYNWLGSSTWSQLSYDMCGPTSASPWSQYSNANPPQSMWIGEWSDASNYDNPAYTNFSDESVAENLRTLHANQMSLYYTSPGVVGQFYWSLRMGSGWQPWPTSACPNGCQVNGTSASKSFPSFNYRVWNFLELVANKIALPLSSYNITGLCECNGCDPNVVFQLDWQPGGHCMYAESCDFRGGDFDSKEVPSWQCSDACFDKSDCTNFAWTDYNGGTCWLKTGDIPPNQAIQTSSPGALCGIMTYQGKWTQQSGAITAAGCDFIDNDIKHVPVVSLANCQSQCQQAYSCTNFVFDQNSNQCYLKFGSIPQWEAIVAPSTSICGVMGG